MSTTKYPVDSRTCTNCGAVGAHAPGCVGASAQADGMDIMTTPCPPWCTTSAEVHATDDPGHALHSGAPLAGDFRPWRNDEPGRSGELTMSLYADVYDLSPDALRQLASNALKAAEWIEANR